MQCNWNDNDNQCCVDERTWCKYACDHTQKCREACYRSYTYTWQVSLSPDAPPPRPQPPLFLFPFHRPPIPSLSHTQHTRTCARQEPGQDRICSRTCGTSEHWVSHTEFRHVPLGPLAADCGLSFSLVSACHFLFVPFPFCLRFVVLPLGRA